MKALVDDDTHALAMLRKWYVSLERELYEMCEEKNQVQN